MRVGSRKARGDLLLRSAFVEMDDFGRPANAVLAVNRDLLNGRVQRRFDCNRPQCVNLRQIAIYI